MIKWDDLIVSLTLGDIVPVIGDDLILVKNKDDIPIPLHRYIAEQLTQKLEEISYNGQRIGELNTTYPKENIMTRAKTIYEKIPEDRFCVEPIEKLAAITSFDFYISTALDHQLEKALCKTRNITINQVETIDYPLQKNDQIPLPLGTGDAPQVTVFNLLGKIRDINESAFTEECTLEHFFSFASQHYPYTLAGYFMKHIRNKILLFIGCDFPDWFMRFIIRIMTNKRYSEYILTHFIFSDEINKEKYKELKNFLKQFKIEINPTEMYQGGNVAAFVDELHRRWVDTVKNYPVYFEETVFLSYNHPDQEMVKTLKQLLKTKGIRNVWFDIDDLEAGEHKLKIEEEIRNCKVFIPLISKNSLSNNQGYMWKVEWAGIENRLNSDKYYLKMSFRIIPIILDDTARDDERIPKFMRDFAIWELENNRDRIIEEITKALTPIVKK